MYQPMFDFYFFSVADIVTAHLNAFRKIQKRPRSQVYRLPSVYLMVIKSKILSVYRSRIRITRSSSRDLDMVFEIQLKRTKKRQVIIISFKKYNSYLLHPFLEFQACQNPRHSWWLFFVCYHLVRRSWSQYPFISNIFLYNINIYCTSCLLSEIRLPYFV